jgi:hypothetical protein
MSDTEDYPGPSKGSPEKKGQGADPGGRAGKKMVKPAKPKAKSKKERTQPRH